MVYTYGGVVGVCVRKVDGVLCASEELMCMCLCEGFKYVFTGLIVYSICVCIKTLWYMCVKS